MPKVGGSAVKQGLRKFDGSTRRHLQWCVLRYKIDLADILRLMSNNIWKTQRKLALKQTTEAGVHLPDVHLKHNEIHTIVLR